MAVKESDWLALILTDRMFSVSHNNCLAKCFLWAPSQMDMWDVSLPYIKHSIWHVKSWRSCNHSYQYAGPKGSAKSHPKSTNTFVQRHKVQKATFISPALFFCFWFLNTGFTFDFCFLLISCENSLGGEASEGRGLPDQRWERCEKQVCEGYKVQKSCSATGLNI